MEKKPKILSITIPLLSEADQEKAVEVFKTPGEQVKLVKQLAAGNIGAFRVCSNLASQSRYALLAKLEELDIRGPKIWLAYKDLGGGTYDGMEEAVFSLDILDKLAAFGY